MSTPDPRPKFDPRRAVEEITRIARDLEANLQTVFPQEQPGDALLAAHVPVLLDEHVPGRTRFVCSCGTNLSHSREQAQILHDAHLDDLRQSSTSSAVYTDASGVEHDETCAHEDLRDERTPMEREMGYPETNPCAEIDSTAGINYADSARPQHLREALPRDLHCGSLLTHGMHGTCPGSRTLRFDSPDVSATTDGPSPIQDLERNEQFSIEPGHPGVMVWGDADECIEVNDLDPGDTYYARTVTYGPWRPQTVPEPTPEPEQPDTGGAAVSTAQIRALVALLGPGEMTPTAKRQFLAVCEAHEARFSALQSEDAE